MKGLTVVHLSQWSTSRLSLVVRCAAVL